MTNEQKKAFKRVPSCVGLDGWDGTWEHIVFNVEHPVCMYLEGEDTYTKREARYCQKWLLKYAPESEYAKPF